MSSATDNPLWYTEAVFYELPVKAFADSNGDGFGDFPGLMQKLDYLHDLGITCLWLLPFFPSPLKDDGFDVSDYRAVHPALGTMDEFRAFLDAAHSRDLRVIAEVVVNHTSDQHPWFQAARHSPAGSPLRDFYLWHDAPYSADQPNGQSRRWTWDPVARSYYFHQFFDHEPDLNYENPLVRREMQNVLRFWLDLGLDGMCLTGTSALANRIGTDEQHLPETHQILREFRRLVDAEYPGRVLEAGVHAMPAAARTYFGKSDECHLVPNLPLAQRLFVAVAREDRFPLVDLLSQTPPVPETGQWVLLLRNHDELELTHASDDEQDVLASEYGLPEFHQGSGIVRRLAPMMKNNRRKIELLVGLLFSLPGAPVLYYGDEIGLGDNTFLGDRLGLRTPMHWNSGRNAGFSMADFARLYAPPLLDSVFGYEAVNVEAQQRDSSSLFHWIRRLIALRKKTPALAAGRLEFIESDNPHVVAFTRSSDQGTILVVANLARSAQAAELELSALAGLVPVELFGRSVFPRVREVPYKFTLSPFGFFWFELKPTPDDIASRRAPVPTEEVKNPPFVRWDGRWESLLEGEAREALEHQVIPGFLRAQRWFGGKARPFRSVQITAAPQFPHGSPVRFIVLRVDFENGMDTYLLPLAIRPGNVNNLSAAERAVTVAQLGGPAPDHEALLYDALADSDVCRMLVDAISQSIEVESSGWTIRSEPTSAFADVRGSPDNRLPVTLGPASSSNSLVFFGRRLLLKMFRRLQPGINPDFEIGRFLTSQQAFTHTPRVAGHIEAAGAGGTVMLAILQEFVKSQGDGWKHAIAELSRYYDRALTRMVSPHLLRVDERPLLELAEAVPPLNVLETLGGFRRAAQLLGRRSAEMHLALAATTGNPDFDPEPLREADLLAIRGGLTAEVHRAMEGLSMQLDWLPPEIRGSAAELLDHGRDNPAFFADRVPPHVQAVKTRVHGDYHLGQVLWTGEDYIVLDFEGEPSRPLEDRRAKQSPLKDVAGMLRSLHYAAYAGLFAFTHDRPRDVERLETWAMAWYQWASAAFLREYLATAGRAPFVPEDPGRLAGLLDAFMLEKAFYELVYELNNRPEWLRIPLAGVLALVKQQPTAMDDPADQTGATAPLKP